MISWWEKRYRNFLFQHVSRESIIFETIPNAVHVEQASEIIRFMDRSRNSDDTNWFNTFHSLHSLKSENSGRGGSQKPLQVSLREMVWFLLNVRGQAYGSQPVMVANHWGCQNKIINLNSLAPFVPYDDCSP